MVVASRNVLAKHSRSFSWASVFLPADRRDDAAVVYAMCRLIDDVADEADDVERAEVQLGLLREELEGKRAPRPLVEQFLTVVERRHMDVTYALELIEGVESDLGSVVFESDRELLRYCYRVAGTVGLMMCGVLGVDEKEALPHAIDLGVAMQITNICRDVLEDAERGRVYLPATRLREAGTTPDAVLEGDADRAAVAQVVDDLLFMADRYYASADDGMRYIPARCRLAIVVASRVYRAIGVKLRSNGSDALAGRTIVGAAGTAWWVFLSLLAYTSPRISGLGSYRKHDAQLHEALRGLPGVMAA
jgi:phytoene synthase